MKLAKFWAEASTPTLSVQLYDELDESDEVDESKDGCGGVCWGEYVLKKPHTSNTMLHELAREVRGVEIKRGKPFTLAEYKAVFGKWTHASRSFLRKRHDYFTEFLAKLSAVTMPKGETLESAFQRSQRRQLPLKVSAIPSKGLQSFAGLCCDLQAMFGDQPIMLCQTSIAKLFNVSQQTISDWIRALKTLQVLKLAEPAIRNCRAARYYFIE